MNAPKHTATSTVMAVIAAAALIGAVLAGVWAARQPERFSATTTVAIAPSEAVVEHADVIDVVGGLDRSATVETLAGLATSAMVVATAADNVGVDASDRPLYDIDAVRVINANLVDISVSGPRPAMVAELSNATAEVAAAQFGALYSIYRVDVVTPADVPDTSDRPSALIMAVAGAAVGAVGAAIVLAASRSRQRERHLAAVRSANEGRLAS